jgi:O-antigen/teichoic acid export membrane protein
MLRINRLAKEGIWIVIGQIVTVAGSLVLVRVITEYLDTTQYGQLALGLTVAGFVNQVVMGGIIVGIARYFSIASEKRDLGSYFSASHQLLFFATLVVVFVGLILFAGIYFLNYSNWLGLAAAALLLSVLSGYNAALSNIQNAARQRAIVAFHGGLDAWLKILLTIGIIIWLGASSTAVLVGYTCASFITAVSQYLFLRNAFPSVKEVGKFRPTWTPLIWSYSIPFTTWGAFTWLQQVSDRWALQVFSPTSDVGQYAVLYQLGFTPVVLITGMATSFLGPILYQRSGDATNQERNTTVHKLSWKITRLSLLVCLIVFMFTFVLHEKLFILLVSSEYRSDSNLLPWVVLAAGIFSAGQVLALKLMSDMKPSALTAAKITTALVGLMLNVIGAFLAGIQGVVGAMVAFSVIYFIWMSILAKHANTSL